MERKHRRKCSAASGTVKRAASDFSGQSILAVYFARSAPPVTRTADSGTKGLHAIEYSCLLEAF